MERLADPLSIELRLPAELRMMLVIRLTTAGVLSRARLTLDAVDDVKMAVEEAAGCMIRFSGCAQLLLRYSMAEDRLSITISGECEGIEPEDQSPDELTTIRYILESMVDQVHISGQDSVTSIELMKKLPA